MKSAYLMRGVSLCALATALALASAAPARADEYTDLLDVLRAQGTLNQASYNALKAKHLANQGSHNVARAAPAMNAKPAVPPVATAADAAPAGLSTAAVAERPAVPASMPAGGDFVYVLPYTAGKGVTVRAGAIDVNISGFVNAFYDYSSAGHKNTGVGGGLADNSGFDSSSIRTGLLPAGLIFKASTTQAGIDIATVFGVYPGINAANAGTPFNANGGGSPRALSTPGVDFRQAYVTAGTPTAGTFTFGRNIGLFGADAILNDATLLGVGVTGSNANPANTSLGRIGIGYIYADFLPQISYASPVFGGLQISAGVFSPLDETNFSGLSGTSSNHDTPMFQGKLTYDLKFAGGFAHLWTSGLVQPQQGVTTAAGTTSLTAAAGDVGAMVSVGQFGALGYYYRGHGVGTTALFFDGVDAAGKARDSEGFYTQISFKPTPKLKLVASYGQSSLFQAPGENDPTLVRVNRAEIFGAYYSLTDWITLVAEYTHAQSLSHGQTSTSQNSFAAGSILFF